MHLWSQRKAGLTGWQHKGWQSFGPSPRDRRASRAAAGHTPHITHEAHERHSTGLHGCGGARDVLDALLAAGVQCVVVRLLIVVPHT